MKQISKLGLGEIIGLIGVLVAIIAFATPEVRCFVGLKSESCLVIEPSFLEKITGNYVLISWTEARSPITLGFEVQEGSLSIDGIDAKWNVLLQQRYSSNPGQVKMTARGRVLIQDQKLEGVTGGKDNSTDYLDDRWGQVSSDIELAVRGWDSAVSPDPFTISTNTDSNGTTLLQMRNSRGTFTWRKID